MTAPKAAPPLFGPSKGGWLFDRTTDLTVFGGSAAASAILLCVGGALGILHGDTPLWVWLICVLGVDVSHVWSSLFRVYFDRSAFKQQPLLFCAIPLCCYGLSVMLYAFGAPVFWRALAYVAVFHFVRQQVGFMTLAARRSGPEPAWEQFLDRSTVYGITLHPIIVWHTRLPQRFAWFMQGDFLTGLPTPFATWSGALMWGLLGLFAARQLWRLARGMLQPAKLLIVLTTFACWYGGIVVLASDFAFTVTNVLIHGLPYMTLTYRYARSQQATPSWAAKIVTRGVWAFLAVCLGLACLEELAWDVWVWHEHSVDLFQVPELLPSSLLWLVPLLSLPQLTHYVLDGFVWRVRDQGSVLRRELEGA